MNLKTILSALFILGANPLWSQISGHVYLYENGKQVPASFAEVYWEGTTVGTTTNEEGFFEIQKVNGHNTLIAQFTGYEPMSKIMISRKGTTNFVLIPISTELNDVTVTGESLATQVNAKAAGLHFEMDSKELRKAACCNLSESFETNASIDVSFSDGITGTKQIEMLGLSGKYALIQRENIPFARGLNAQNGLSYVPGPFIESIQVTKGLSSVLNGYESITGQINVEYFKPETAPQLLLNVFGNTGGRNEINLMVRDSWKDVSEAHNLTLLHFSSVPFAQDRNNDGFADISNGRQLNLMNRTHYHIGDNWEGQFGILLIDDLRQGGQLNYLENTESNFWGFSNSERRLEVFGKTGYLFPNKELRSLGIIYRGSLQSRNASYGYRETDFQENSFYLNTILHDFIGSLEHQFKTGISLQIDDVSEALNYVSPILNPNSVVTNLYEHSRQEIVPGAYFEYSFEPHDNFSLVAGLRADYNSYFEKAYASPRLQMRYKLNRNTTFRLSGGRGLRSPNRLAENSSILASSRDLVFWDRYFSPEIAWNSGFSWNQNLVFGETLIRWNTDVFFTWFEQKMVTDLDFDPRKAFILSREGSNSISMLSQMDYTYKDKLDLRLAYKYLRSQDRFFDGLALAYQVPLHRAFFNVGYAISESFKLDATLNWFGSKRLPSTVKSPEAFKQAAESPDYFTVNSQVNYTYKKFEFFVGADNLFDFRQEQPIVNADNPWTPYFDSNFIWGPIFGRNIYAGLYYSF